MEVRLNREYVFDWNKNIEAGDWMYEVTVIRSRYMDDYWHIKHFGSYLKDLLGISNSLDKIPLYLTNLMQSFNKEQSATTTMIPLGYLELESSGDLPIKVF